MPKITDEQYAILEHKLAGLYENLQERIEDHYRTQELDGSDTSGDIELRAFDQGKVAALRQFLPFVLSDDILFRAIEIEVDELKQMLG